MDFHKTWHEFHATKYHFVFPAISNTNLAKQPSEMVATFLTPLNVLQILCGKNTDFCCSISTVECKTK
jgi:hypothetical protein